MQQQQPISDRLMTQGKSLWSAISKKEILLPTAFLFMWQASNSCSQFNLAAPGACTYI